MNGNWRTHGTLFIATFAACAFGGLLSATQSVAGVPWIHVTATTRPTVLEPGGTAQVVLSVANLGDGNVNAQTTPLVIADSLPKELHALTIEGVSGKAGNFGSTAGPVTCSLAKLPAKPTPSCSYAGTLPPFDQIEVRIGVKVGEEITPEEVNQVSVTGGEAAPVTLSGPLSVGGEGTPFGLSDYELGPEEEGGGFDTQAGSHPFQLTTSLVLNQSALAKNKEGFPEAHPASLLKDLNVKLPPGLIGNPNPFPRCKLTEFFGDSSGNETDCPAQTVLGVAMVTINEANLGGITTFTVPIVNLEPALGEPARFGFLLPVTPVFIDTSLRSDGDYGITASSLNTSQTADFLNAEVTFWGTPGDPRHDPARGSGCISVARGEAHSLPCAPLEQSQPPAFMIMPTSCAGPLSSSVELDSWALPADAFSVPASRPLPAPGGCNRLSFAPQIEAKPSTDRASAPSGLDFNLDFRDEGLTSSAGLAQSQLKDVSVTLPEGFTINPSAGVGLGGCTPADYARETLSSEAGAGCPNNSKLGTVEVTTPLLATAIHGSLFIAQPHDNPFNSLIALYVVLKNPETGILIKLAGRVTPDPLTGRLTTTFENNPQLAFDHFNFHFREGQQAPLISPATCGTYITQAQLTPWADPASAIAETSPFTITKGFDGGACPAGRPPFNPQIQSGTTNNNAGAFSSLFVHLTRTDAEQEIASFSTNLPPGLTGELSGIPFCPEAAIALARTKTGTAEEAAPSCPAASQIGHTLVGTGVGAVLAYVPGKVYLAGPYNGDPFSIVSVTSADVGPFDLGTVVLRFALRIDPHTAQVSVDPTASEPIPTIIQGIVTHVRDIRVYIDRPSFILNPTSCAPMSISSTLSSDLGQSATVISPFQAASCASLRFAPAFAARTSGKTSKAAGASLAVKLTYPYTPQGTQSNIAKVKVELPRQLPSRLTTLQKACTAAQFNANPAGCPEASVVGHAKAVTPLLPVPLEGPAYFVSNGGEAFPNLIMVLQGYGVTIDLVGDTFINKAGITSSTFKAVPDQPVTSFELTLPEGPHSALAAPKSLCGLKLKMPTEFVAQNGATLHQSTPIAISGCQAKPETRAQKLAAALKACKKKAKAKRAACVRQAQKRFGAKKKGKGAKRKKQ
jgi:hypothetical protein